MKKLKALKFRILSMSILALASMLSTTAQANQFPLMAEAELTLILTLSSSNGGLISSRIKYRSLQDSKITTIKKSSDGREIVLAKDTALSEGQIKNILRMKAASNFFERPFRVNRGGFDGVLWRLEIIEGGKAHSTERWSPLPPYYSKRLDKKTGRLVPIEPEKAIKQSDEVALDMLCILIMMSTPGFDELLY
ncbi:hypothetical protein DOQ73_23260 [Salmonella enterica subsp. enterica]|nr:hypothetical protein [Salmonella enterica subsp. enterica serovar Javiana]